VIKNNISSSKRYKWVPISNKNLNSDVEILPPPPGVIVFRPSESFTYPNASRQCDILVDYIRKETRRGIDSSKHVKLGDRPWNDHGPRNRVIDPDHVDARPVLRAIVFDFSATPQIDITGVQSLADVRQELNKYSDRDVEYHFAGVLSPWARRALLAEGFGRNRDDTRPDNHYVQVARLDGLLLGQRTTEDDTKKKGKYRDEEERDSASSITSEGEYVPLLTTDTPFFHLDIPEL